MATINTIAAARAAAHRGELTADYIERTERPDTENRNAIVGRFMFQIVPATGGIFGGIANTAELAETCARRAMARRNAKRK